jgi:hypothetical protein
MRRAGYFVPFLMLLMIVATAPALAESRVALVVGNADYRNVPSLANPLSDARLMASTLKTLGFRLVGDGAQINLDKAAFDGAVRNFGAQLQGADVALFYYAGHGLQVHGANYLVPVSANLMREADVDFELEDVALVLRQMEAAGTRLNLVMLDACRNNPFGGRGLRSIDSGLAQMRAPEGTLISFATQPGNVAQDGVSGNSPYSKAVAQTIQRPGLGVFDAFNEVGLKVKRATGGEQQPWVSSSPIAGSFYFAGLKKEDEAPPPATRVSLQDSATPAAALTKVSIVEPQSEPSAPLPTKPVATPPELKQTKLALVSPVQTPPAPPSEDDRKGERGLAVYNGNWAGRYSGCAMNVNGRARINNGAMTGSDGFGSGMAGQVSPDGHVSGHFAFGGLIRGRFTGRMSSSSTASGTWSNEIGCSGVWNMSR